MNDLQRKYIEKVRPQLMKEFGYGNVMAAPKIGKVSINVGLSRASREQNFKESVVRDLKAITGQAPVITKAKKAVAGFKIRENQEVGATVTLRGAKMWDFVYKLISTSLPRIKDFQGISEKCFDKQGNLSIGVKEHLIFPEISPDDVSTIMGLQVNVATTAKSQQEGKRFLKLIGFPINIAEDQKS